jgi:hypothetical protein
VLDIPTGDTARDRWLALHPNERRKILRDGAAGQAQGLPELARIAAGWARTAADESRHRATGYLAAVLVGAAGALAVGGLLPPFARAAGLLWFGLVCLVALLAARVEAQQRQVYAWVEACNLNYLLSLRSSGPEAPEPTSSLLASLVSPDAGRPGPTSYTVHYRAPAGRYAILVVAGLVPLGAAIGTGLSPVTGALTLVVAGWVAAVLGRDAQRRVRPLAVLRPAGLDLPRLGLVVPWSEIGWVFVGIRGRRYAVGVHWVLRSPVTGERLADRAAIEPHRRTRLRRKLKDDPRFTLPSLLCREAPETLVLLTAAVQYGRPVRQAVPSQLPGNGKAPVISGP